MQPRLRSWNAEYIGIISLVHNFFWLREIYFKSHISLWEHSSHFRLIGRGVPSVSVVSQLVYKFLCLASPKENPQGKGRWLRW